MNKTRLKHDLIGIGILAGALYLGAYFVSLGYSASKEDERMKNQRDWVSYIQGVKSMEQEFDEGVLE